MAKNAGRLAGLAALAGAAYMMSRGKDKGKSDDAGDQKTSSYTKDTKKVESDGTKLKSPAESIAAADKSDKSTSISDKGASGTTTPGPDKSVPNLDVKPAPAPKPKVEAQVDKDVKLKSVSKPSDKSVKLAPENRDLEKNTSRGISAKQKPVSTVSSSAEGMKNYKPRSTQPSSAKDPAVYGLKEAVKTSASVAKPPPAPAPVAAKTSDAPKSTDTTNKFKHEMPITKFFKGIREAGEKDLATRGMKRGGAVKKMASGGMTASRRADGIATRGKTRCKMY